MALDEVKDGGNQTHFVRRRGALLRRAFIVGISSRSGAGAGAVLELFRVVAVTTAAVGEADVSVGVSAPLFVDFADGGLGERFAGDFTAAGGDILAENAWRGVFFLGGVGSGTFESDHCAVEVWECLSSGRLGCVFGVAVGRR